MTPSTPETPEQKPLPKTVLPCGCVTEVVECETPAFDEKGFPVLNPDETFKMNVTETIRERFCKAHTTGFMARQEVVQQALAAGVDGNIVSGLLAGASPFPMLGAGLGVDEDVEGEGEADEGAGEEPSQP